MKASAGRIERDGVTLWFAGKHPRTPWVAKALGGFVVAYALSPIDLIADFTVLGVLDPLLLPGRIGLAVRLRPMSSRRAAPRPTRGCGPKAGSPRSRLGAILVVLLWIAIGVAAWLCLRSRGGPSPS